MVTEAENILAVRLKSSRQAQTRTKPQAQNPHGRSPPPPPRPRYLRCASSRLVSAKKRSSQQPAASSHRALSQLHAFHKSIKKREKIKNKEESVLLSSFPLGHPTPDGLRPLPARRGGGGLRAAAPGPAPPLRRGRGRPPVLPLLLPRRAPARPPAPLLRRRGQPAPLRAPPRRLAQVGATGLAPVPLCWVHPPCWRARLAPPPR